MVETIKLDLTAEVLTSFGEALLPVTGDSMFPCMRPGDVVSISRSGEAIREGDVVVFERYRRLVAHRVVDCTGALIITRGDRLRHADQPVPRSAILGRVRSIQRGERSIDPRAGFLTRIAATLLSRTDFGTRAALYLARMIRS
jgi:signal peptidase I